MRLGRFAASSLILGVVALACGPAEPPPKPPPAPAPVKDPAVIATASKACARASACSSRFKDPNACVSWWIAPGASETLKKCLDAATGCEAVTTCLHGGGDAKAAAFCGNRGVVSGCDGNRLVSCGDDDAHEATVVDCAEMGATCAEIKSAGGLVVRACSAPSKCANAPDVRCDGTAAVVSCRDGAYERVVCPAGTKCEEHRDEVGDAAASCVVPGQRRCVGGLRRCEDDRLVECERGKAKVTDCVGQGLRCAGVGPRAGCYVPENVECDKEMLPRCDGGNVVFCAAGRLEKIACSSLGLGPCDPSAKGPFAACSPAVAKPAK
ncbi:MAG: hypothetical protein U0270_04035 [Labilithrix sp.]